MSRSLELSLKRAGCLSNSPPEESATFGLLSVKVDDHLLTEAISREGKKAPPTICEGPNISGYPLAEWLLWNWWRLHWDESVPPHRAIAARSRWDFAHCMETIGEGYVWPKITIVPEGKLINIINEPSLVQDSGIFRYIAAAQSEVVPTRCFTSAVDQFVRQVLADLEEEKLHDTNLHKLWNDLDQERKDPKLSRFRRAEAQLALDPDEVREEYIWQCLEDARVLGEWSWGEMAAEVAYQGMSVESLMSAQSLQNLAVNRGFVASRGRTLELDESLRIEVENSGALMPTLPGQYVSFQGMSAPWKIGKDMANQLRNQEKLDTEPLDDECLGSFAGLSPDAITRTHRRGNSLAYMLLDEENQTRVVLRSSRRTGRRFELARLIGDRLFASLNSPDDTLFPATNAYTYRQKAQRAFAAELLSPFHAVEDLLSGDYSTDRQQKVADHFRVSPMTISTQLVNHGRIRREDAPHIAQRGNESYWT